jgi:hypothetical protein
VIMGCTDPIPFPFDRAASGDDAPAGRMGAMPRRRRRYAPRTDALAEFHSVSGEPLLPSRGVVLRV